ncbi:unnamed protein product, partial [Coregonus sp. 'balchen']
MSGGHQQHHRVTGRPLQREFIQKFLDADLFKRPTARELLFHHEVDQSRMATVLEEAFTKFFSRNGSLNPVTVPLRGCP